MKAFSLRKLSLLLQPALLSFHPSHPSPLSPFSQDTETSALVTVPGKMPSPGPSAITSDSEPEETTESGIEPGPETQIKKPKMYSFRHDWLTQFPWLRYDKGQNAMHCICCRDCGQNMAGNSAFVGEATTFRIETLKKHVQKAYNML